MLFIQQLEDSISFIAEAAIEVFSPNHDSYPATGLQPFTDEPYKGKSNWGRE
jgi:hypothetical protein